MRSALCVWMAICAATISAQQNNAPQNALDTHLAAARKARDEKRYADAEREGDAAVREAEKLGQFSPRLNGALSDLGLTFYVQGKYSQAEPFYFRATEIAEPAGIDARTLSNQLAYLGLSRQNGGKHEAAVQPLERAIPLMEKAVGADHRDVA